MKDLGVDKYSIVGLSVGGMWGAHLANLYKEEVTGLIIMDSYLGAEEEEAKQEYFKLINATEGGFSRGVAEQVSPFFFSSENPNPELVKMCEDRLMEFDKDYHIPHIMKLGQIIFGREDSLGILIELKKAKIPVKIMVGEYDIPRPPSEAKEMARLIGDEPVIIENSGHIPTVENPERTNAVIGEALASMLVMREKL
jgi:pimeloyl-ACP methyl ester carboxylesterase